jgi:hypothetical protein
MIRTDRPPAAPSATVREYPPCTRADSDPQAGQDPGDATHDAEITTAFPVSSTRWTFSPASCGNSRASSIWPSSDTSMTRAASGTEGTGIMAHWAGNEAPEGQVSWRIPASYRSLVARSRRHASTSRIVTTPAIPPRQPRETGPALPTVSDHKIRGRAIYVTCPRTESHLTYMIDIALKAEFSLAGGAR